MGRLWANNIRALQSVNNKTRSVLFFICNTIASIISSFHDSLSDTPFLQLSCSDLLSGGRVGERKPWVRLLSREPDRSEAFCHKEMCILRKTASPYPWYRKTNLENVGFYGCWYWLISNFQGGRRTLVWPSIASYVVTQQRVNSKQRRSETIKLLLLSTSVFVMSTQQYVPCLAPNTS